MYALKCDAAEALHVSRQVRRLLAGLPAHVQGAVLADLVSIWLAGHYAPDDPEATHRLRAGLFDDLCRAVRSLVPASAVEIGAPR